MKVKWWVYALLAASLAVHAGVLAGVVVRRVQEWKWRRVFAQKWLKPGVTIRQVDSLFGWPDFPAQAENWRRYRETRREFGELGLEASPDSVRVRKLTGLLADVERTRRARRAGIFRGMRLFYREDAWDRFRRLDSLDAVERDAADRRWRARLAAQRRKQEAR